MMFIDLVNWHAELWILENEGNEQKKDDLPGGCTLVEARVIYSQT